MKDFERGRKNWVEPLREWILDTKQADFLAKSDNLHEIKSFVQKIGTNPLVRDKSAHFSFSVPSAFAASRRGFLPPAAPEARHNSALTREEVSLCGAFWLKSELFLTKIRTLNSEIQSLGRAKRKGVGGKEFLPALAFPPPPNFVPVKLARCLIYSSFSCGFCFNLALATFCGIT